VSRHQIFGIDCGASKVMAQSAIYDSKSNLISPDKINLEYNYSTSNDWDPNFNPVPIKIQIKEQKNEIFNLTKEEKIQSKIIIKTIQKIISKIKSTSIGLCYPGLKNKSGIILMANGPRIPNLISQIPKISTIYNDSDCCLYGEINSTIGKIKKSKHVVYIGGGTGIADGIILNGKIIDFNIDTDIKKSWELLLPSKRTIESCLSPNGIITAWNKKNMNKIKSLYDLEDIPNSKSIFKTASKAFSYLIKNRTIFFKKYNSTIEKIVIGQRLGEFLKNCKPETRAMFELKTNIPIEYSSDRRTAALGAAWMMLCS